jgi:outer membrane protein TolC
MMVDTLYRDVQTFVESGLAQRNDLLKVQLKQNELESNLLKVRNGIVMTSRALCQHIGIMYDPAIVFGETETLPEQVPVVDINADQAVLRRTEYDLLNEAVRAEELQKKMTMGEYMPQVAVTGAGVYYDVMNNADKAALGIATISIPISDWWGGAHKIKEQQLKVDKARIDLEETRELLALQVQQTGNEWTESWYQMKLAEKSAEQATENLRVTEDNYHAGIVPLSDLLEAQAMLQQSNDGLTDARCTFRIKKARHLQAIGEYK